MQDAAIQRFAAGVVTGRADAGATAIGQRVPGQGVWGRGVRPPVVVVGAWGTPSSPTSGLWHGPHRSKKEARRRRSRTLCRVPALTWQFMSCALVIYTLVPGGGGAKPEDDGCGGQIAMFPTRPSPILGPTKTPLPPPAPTTQLRASSSTLRKGQRLWRHRPRGTQRAGALAHKTTSIRKNRQQMLAP